MGNRVSYLLRVKGWTQRGDGHAPLVARRRVAHHRGGHGLLLLRERPATARLFRDGGRVRGWRGGQGVGRGSGRARRGVIRRAGVTRGGGRGRGVRRGGGRVVQRQRAGVARTGRHGVVRAARGVDNRSCRRRWRGGPATAQRAPYGAAHRGGTHDCGGGGSRSNSRPKAATVVVMAMTPTMVVPKRPVVPVVRKHRTYYAGRKKGANYKSTTPSTTSPNPI